MSFLKKLFQSTPEPEIESTIHSERNTIYSPVSGRIVPLSTLNDGVFSEGVLGQGCAILPEDECIYAPFNGTVIQVIDSKHAVGILSDDGIELLIHIGIDTVTMNGKGFTTHISTGEKVHLGQKLISFRKKAIADAGFVDSTAVIITNIDDYKNIQLYGTESVSHGDKILAVEK